MNNTISSKWVEVCCGIRYSTIETKKGPVLDITGFFFRISIQLKALYDMYNKNPSNAIVNSASNIS
jgi:hypothetical protein